MPKPNSLSDLFTLLTANDAPPSPHHFLFMLGTDTNFTAKPTAPAKDYERGETLSYTAQAVVKVLGESDAAEIRPTGEPLSYCSPSVDVLNGPTTLGTEVGERVAQGIFLALRAIAGGKTTLQIAAHSRGAVEATLLMHELDRIKKALVATPAKALKDILLESPCALTRAAIIKFFPQAVTGETPELRVELARRLTALKVNSFLMDPVPGDTTYGLPGFGWHDDRFYKETPCTYSELLLCRDERTTCFYPIIPKGMSPTIIPGHHGTASGNKYTQQYQTLPGILATADTTAVQDLVLLKLFHFLHQATGIMSRREDLLALGHAALDTLANQFLTVDERTRRQLLLETYRKIKANDAAYSHFSTTAYAYLGRRAAPDGHRYIHDGSPGYKSMSSIAPEMRGPIVNAEHARLFLADYVDFDGTRTAEPDVQVSAITLTLRNMVDAMRSGSGDHRLVEIVSTDPGQALFFNGLSILVDSIGQKYLRNNLAIADKLRLKNVLAEPFTLLSEAITDEGLMRHKAILERFQGVLQDGVKVTLEAHYRSLVQQHRQLQQQIQLFVAAPAQFVGAYRTFVATLAVEGDGLPDILEAIKGRLNALEPIDITSVERALSLELTQIEASGLEKLQKEKLKEALFNTAPSKNLQAYFEAYQANTEQHLAKIEQLYNNVVELHSVYPELSRLAGAKTIDVDREQLLLRSIGLRDLAGCLLHKKEYNLRIKPDTVSEEFFALAKSQAIVFGAPSPEIADLQGAIAAGHQTIGAKDASIRQLQSRDEITCAHLIEQKLLPLTVNYLHYLLRQARRYNTQITERDITQELPAVEGLTLEANHAYNKIKNKFDSVKNLHQQLTAADVILPSQRLINFTGRLQACETDLKSHRDPAWKAYFKSCIAAVAIVATGIIPGLLGLAAYSKVTGRSPLFFNKSNGAKFVEEATLSVPASPRAGA